MGGFDGKAHAGSRQIRVSQSVKKKTCLYSLTNLPFISILGMEYRGWSGESKQPPIHKITTAGEAQETAGWTSRPCKLKENKSMQIVTDSYPHDAQDESRLDPRTSR